MNRSLLAFCLLFVVFVSPAQTWQDTVKKIDGIINQYYPQLTPGGQLSISRNGGTLYSKAWGLADMERPSPISLQTKIEAGSVSKQFTAASILLLEQQGKLSTEDDVRKYIPELPDYGNTIRIKHLLDHSSGLRDWGSVAALAGWARSTKFYRNEDALEIIARQKRLNHVPGAEFIYSNTNYTLMTIIVDRVSGMSHADFTRKFIFEPAGMTHTEWRDDPHRIVPGRAIAYSYAGDRFVTDMPNEYVYGHGGLLTTTEDLLLWNRYYLSGKPGGAAFLSKQTTPRHFNNGVLMDYAAGLFIQPVRGRKSINHSGATAGYRAYLLYFPEYDLHIAMLSNTPKNFSQASRAVFEMMIPLGEDKAVVDMPSYTGPANADSFKGWYRNERDGVGTRLEMRDGSLTMFGTRMEQMTASWFKLGDERVEFNNKGLLRITPRDTIAYSRMPGALAEKEFGIYTGTYHSDETHSELTVYEEKGKLMIRLKPGQAYIMIPTYKDAFNVLELDGGLQFTRVKGRVDGFNITISRARNIRFVKR
jgi:CubicO group peptidase (beta-lactamase class C family)